MDVRELEADVVGTTLYLNFTAFSFRYPCFSVLLQYVQSTPEYQILRCR